MPLADHIATLNYKSGNRYYVGLEASTDTVRVFWEETDDGNTEAYWQCFTTFDSVDEDGNPLADQTIINKADEIIVAHQLEDTGSLNRARTI